MLISALHTRWQCIATDVCVHVCVCDCAFTCAQLSCKYVQHSSTSYSMLQVSMHEVLAAAVCSTLRQT